MGITGTPHQIMSLQSRKSHPDADVFSKAAENLPWALQVNTSVCGGKRG